jgi:hypothetical protein
MAVMATARTRSLVEQASAELLGPGAAAAPLTLKGSDALVFYRRDEQELKRRHAVGAHRLDRIAALTTLLQLPVDEPVPLALLKADPAAGVRRLPYGAAELQGGHVRRRAVRPLTVDLVVVQRGQDGKCSLEPARLPVSRPMGREVEHERAFECLGDARERAEAGRGAS